jgi:hypothetical protein
MTDRCHFEGLVGCRPDTVATVGLKGEDVVAGGASLRKLQHDVSLGAGGPTHRGKSLEPRIGNEHRSIFHFGLPFSLCRPDNRFCRLLSRLAAGGG